MLYGIPSNSIACGRRSHIGDDDPAQAMPDFYQLATEVFALVETGMPHLDLTTTRAKFLSRRQPFDEPPIKISLLS